MKCLIWLNLLYIFYVRLYSSLLPFDRSLEIATSLFLAFCGRWSFFTIFSDVWFRICFICSWQKILIAVKIYQYSEIPVTVLLKYFRYWMQAENPFLWSLLHHSSINDLPAFKDIQSITALLQFHLKDPNSLWSNNCVCNIVHNWHQYLYSPNFSIWSKHSKKETICSKFYYIWWNLQITREGKNLPSSSGRAVL